MSHNPKTEVTRTRFTASSSARLTVAVSVLVWSPGLITLSPILSGLLNHGMRVDVPIVHGVLGDRPVTVRLELLRATSDFDCFPQVRTLHLNRVPPCDEFAQRLSARSSPCVRKTRGRDAASASNQCNRSLCPAWPLR